MSRKRSQRGLALISALLIVSLAGILAAGRMFSLQLETRATASLMDSSRARLIALGFEERARELLRADALSSDTDNFGESWARGLGGANVGSMLVQGTLEDMQGRFNVNNLITPQGTADLIALEQFQRLLRTLGLDEALAVKVLDWVDADNLPQERGGAEDEAYTRLSPPYQAPNRPIEDVSELLAVEGFDSISWRILAPHIAALPATGGPTPVNLNTAGEAVFLSLADNTDPIRIQQWRQLQVTGGTIDMSDAKDRLPSRMKERVSPSSDWFLLRVAIQVDGTRFFMSSLLNRQSGQVQAHWRRQGLPAEAWLAPAES